jgi:hypothetical protein
LRSIGGFWVRTKDSTIRDVRELSEIQACLHSSVPICLEVIVLDLEYAQCHGQYSVHYRLGLDDMLSGPVLTVNRRPVELHEEND